MLDPSHHLPQILAAFTEPKATAILLGAFGALTVLAVVLSRFADRMGVPVVLLFLILGMLGGSEGIGGIAFSDFEVAVRLGTTALILILFDGGMNTAVTAVREVFWPATVLATVGVILTAAALAGIGLLIGLPWPVALLIGAVVSSTDAAAVFAVLRGGRLNLRPRLARTLEVESCANDPMALILTTALIQVLSSPDSLNYWQLAVMVPVQLLVGGGIGILFGYLFRWLMLRVRVSTTGFYPCLSVAAVLASFGAATACQGSGFLAVYAAGVVLGNGPLPYKASVIRVHDALGWLSQIFMFLMMGLLVVPSQLIPIFWSGLAVSLLLAFVARPIAVWLCLLPYKMPAVEKHYIAWIGLRGAVPIILGTFPVLAGVEGAYDVFNYVFFIVVVSTIIPGSTIRPMTRWLKLNIPDKPAPEAVLEINSVTPLEGEIVSYYIEPALAVSGARLSEIDFPHGTSVVLIVRNGQLIPARGDTRIENGDHVYVFFRPEDRPFIELLFGKPEES